MIAGTGATPDDKAIISQTVNRVGLFAESEQNKAQ